MRRRGAAEARSLHQIACARAAHVTSAILLIASMTTIGLAFHAQGAHAAPIIDPGAQPFDLIPDGIIDFSDVQEVVVAWNTQRDGGLPCQGLADPSRDVNHDGCIDVADVQAVASHVGVVVRAQASTSLDTMSDAARDVEAANSQLALAASSTFTVNSVVDDPDATPGDGICATASGECTLRSAIEEANLVSGANTITFNIPGAGVHTIIISSPLPTISDETGPLTIDGYTQPGSVPNTDPVLSNAVINVEISGNLSEPDIVCTYTICNLTHAFIITSPGNTIRGLATYKVRRSYWLHGAAAHDNVIVGNFIGASSSGQLWATQAYNAAYGIALFSGAANNRIGGTSPADRNVISGNAQDGVNAREEDTDGNQFIGNIIGLGKNGRSRGHNRGDGIDLNLGSSSNSIVNNVISGNLDDGIEISHSPATSDNQVIGNLIGTDTTGNNASPSVYGNRHFGIGLEDGVANNIIANNVIANNVAGGIQIYGDGNTGNQVHDNHMGVGLNGTPIPSGPYGILIRLYAVGEQIGPNNIISNFDTGVFLSDSTVRYNTITRNSFFNNTNLGIDIDPAGVNLNDQYWHGGPNDRLNFPVITTADPTAVTGTACAGCTVEIFKADSSASEYGEGKTFVGSGTADGSGNFSVVVTVLAPGEVITSTATDSLGNTSEFSLNFAVCCSLPGISLPGTIQAEDYRSGGEGVGYHDTTSGNTGGQYRTDDVDLGACTDGPSPCYYVGWIATGEWTAYDVNVTSAGSYTFTFRASAWTTGRKLHLELDGAPLGGAVTLPNTGGYQNWTDVTAGPFSLTAGAHTLRIVYDTASINLNYVTVN